MPECTKLEVISIMDEVLKDFDRAQYAQQDSNQRAH